MSPGERTRRGPGAGLARASRGPPGAGRAPGPPRRWSAAGTSGAGPRLPSARALLHVCGHVRRSPTARPGALRRARPCGMRPRTPPPPAGALRPRAPLAGPPADPPRPADRPGLHSCNRLFIPAGALHQGADATR